MLEEREAEVELNGGEKVESEWGTDIKPASVFTILWIKEEQKCTNENTALFKTLCRGIYFKIVSDGYFANFENFYAGKLILSSFEKKHDCFFFYLTDIVFLLCGCLEL